MARLLCEAVNDECPGTECHLVLDEIEALRTELRSIRDGQVVVCFYDKLAPVVSALQEFHATPVATLGEAGADSAGAATAVRASQ